MTRERKNDWHGGRTGRGGSRELSRVTDPLTMGGPSPHFCTPLSRRRLRGHPDDRRTRMTERAAIEDSGVSRPTNGGDGRRSHSSSQQETHPVKRQPKGAKERTQTIQVWTYDQAQAAVPYISSILRSLREHALEALQHYHRAKRLANRPGRPNRATIIAQQEAEKDAHQADDRFRGALDELQEMDIYTLDPIQGQ